MMVLIMYMNVPTVTQNFFVVSSNNYFFLKICSCTTKVKTISIRGITECFTRRLLLLYILLFVNIGSFLYDYFKTNMIKLVAILFNILHSMPGMIFWNIHFPFDSPLWLISIYFHKWIYIIQCHVWGVLVLRILYVLYYSKKQLTTC